MAHDALRQARRTSARGGVRRPQLPRPSAAQVPAASTTSTSTAACLLMRAWSWTHACCQHSGGIAEECRAGRSMSSSEECSVLVVNGASLVQEVTSSCCSTSSSSAVSDRMLSTQSLQACQRHKTSPTASAALGRALLGTLLLATFRGEGETTQVTFQGNGPLGQIQVLLLPRRCVVVVADSSRVWLRCSCCSQTIAKADGLIKGRVSNPACDLPLRDDGKLAVGAAVGLGTCTQR